MRGGSRGCGWLRLGWDDATLHSLPRLKNVLRLSRDLLGGQCLAQDPEVRRDREDAMVELFEVLFAMVVFVAHKFRKFWHLSQWRW